MAPCRSSSFSHCSLPTRLESAQEVRLEPENWGPTSLASRKMG